jgi:hypothetical protein
MDRFEPFGAGREVIGHGIQGPDDDEDGDDSGDGTHDTGDPVAVSACPWDDPEVIDVGHWPADRVRQPSDADEVRMSDLKPDDVRTVRLRCEIG